MIENNYFYLMENHRKAIDFITSAFDDYISGRFLLINNYHINGVILSSMAIEKYLKALLVGIGRNYKTIHLDKVDKLKAAFNDTEYKEVFNYIDPNFLSLLSMGYKCRYYDNIETTQTVGSATNHILAALDTTISLFETLILDVNLNGKLITTRYKRAVNEHDSRIFEQNYLLNKWDQKEFCERECTIFGLHIDPDMIGPISLSSKTSLPFIDNRIMLVDMINEEKVISPFS